MKYCPKCDNIMNISRTIPKRNININQDTNTISETTNTDKKNIINNDNVIKIINMFKNNIDITNEKINSDEITNNPEFIKLKDKEKKDLLKILKTMEDDSLNAYIICKNCSYFEKLTSRTLILNKMSSNTIGNNEITDNSKYKYMRYDNTLPHTRDYICKNIDCITHKDSTKRDAKWFRPKQDTYETYYVCCACGVVWNIA